MSTYQVRSLEEADLIIREHERKTRTAYSLLRSTKNFGCIDIPACSNEEYEVRFDTVGVPYCGVPFYVAGLKILQCQSVTQDKGARGSTNKKKEIKVELTESAVGDTNTSEHSNKSSLIINPRKKKKQPVGRVHRTTCTATVIMKEVIYYPEFQLFEHSKNNRLGIARQLREILRSKVAIQKDRIIYVTVPSSNDHTGHAVGVIPSKRIYVKNDYYGAEDSSPSPAKRVYYPIKEKKCSDGVTSNGAAVTTARSIIDKVGLDALRGHAANPAPQSKSGSIKKEQDIEAKAKEVREVLQSIMGLTYKVGQYDAFQELLNDLSCAKQRYLCTVEAVNKNDTDSQQQRQALIQRQLQPTQQIVLVKPHLPTSGATGTNNNKQIAPKQPGQHHRPLHVKTTHQSAMAQQQQPILHLQPMEQDPSTLSITINAIPTASIAPVTPFSGASLSALTTPVMSMAGSTSDGGGISRPPNIATAIPMGSLPTVSFAGANSLVTLSPGLANGSLPITSIPSFSTVVVPSALQHQAVTLTIPAGSLSSLQPASLSTLPPASIASFTNQKTIAPLSATTIPIVSLPTIQAAGVFPALQTSSLPSLIAAAPVPSSSSSSSACSSILSQPLHNTLSVASLPIAPLSSSSNILLASSSSQPSLTSSTAASSSQTILAPGTIISASCYSQISPSNNIPTNILSGSTNSSPIIKQQHMSSISSSPCVNSVNNITSISKSVSNCLQNIVVAPCSSSAVAWTVSPTTSVPLATTSVQPTTHCVINRSNNSTVVVQASAQQLQVNQQLGTDDKVCTQNTVSSTSSQTTVSTPQHHQTAATSTAASSNSVVSTATQAVGITASTVTESSISNNNTQESSIFIEAMEAILNSHI